MTSRNPNQLPKSLPPNTIPLRVRNSTYYLGSGGHQQAVHILKWSSFRPLVPCKCYKHLGMTCRTRGNTLWGHCPAPTSGCPSLWQCSSTCGKGLQSRVVQCMHKVTGRHGSECPTLSKPAAYRQCHQEVCNDKINVNTITSPRLGEYFWS